MFFFALQDMVGMGTDNNIQLTLEEQMETQLQLYLAEPAVTHTSNPFSWWAANGSRFPQLARVARKFLAIPASSVASERVFSTAGLVVNTRRSALKPEHVEQLVFLSQNLRP